MPIELPPLPNLREWSPLAFTEFLRLLNERITAIALELSRFQQLDVADFTIANGRNNNLALPNASLIRLAGPTGAFSITGISGGTRGRVLMLYNSTAFALTLVNQSSLSDEDNRIVTNTGADLATTGSGALWLFYDTISPSRRWVVIGGQT